MTDEEKKSLTELMQDAETVDKLMGHINSMRAYAANLATQKAHIRRMKADETDPRRDAEYERILNELDDVVRKAVDL